MSSLQPPEGEHFDTHVGLEYLEISGERVRARIPVSAKVVQPFGLVHGGVYSAIAESACSVATATAVWDQGKLAVGLSNHASFLRPITRGWINADARVRHRGRSTWVWEADVTDDEGRLCAMVRVTMAVRDRPAEEPGPGLSEGAAPAR